MSLQSNVTIPILDTPITENEIQNSIKDMKKGGYDYPLPIMHLLKEILTPLLAILMNLLFYITYPIQCAKSLLFTIPKKGNLSKQTNFRGIQMMSAIACLYDRILTTRLLPWIMSRVHIKKAKVYLTICSH